jgi:hypothetical protein
MAVKGVRAQELIAAVLIRVDPHLPPGVHVGMTRHKKWLTLQRCAEGDIRVGPFSATPDAQGRPIHMGNSAVRALGAWIPFLPRQLSSRLAAQDAVETVLDVAYTVPGSNLGGIVCDVQARSDGDVVRISYRRPGDEADERIHLDPIPLSLL